jgi:quercetin dioxygenase-like cupin family protein
MGMVMAWKGQKTMGKFKSGEIIEIEANVQHTFLAMEDTDIFCIHNEEHALVVSEGKIGV